MITVSPSSEVFVTQKGMVGKYPWSKLEIGQSFPVPKDNIKFTTLVSMCYKQSKRKGKVFRAIEHPDCFEVGRLADPVVKQSVGNVVEPVVRPWGNKED